MSGHWLQAFRHHPACVCLPLRAEPPRKSFGLQLFPEWSHEPVAEVFRAKRAVRLLLEHRGEHRLLQAAAESSARAFGCVPQTLQAEVEEHEIDAAVAQAWRRRVDSFERSREETL